jgi:hypothetical protein
MHESDQVKVHALRGRLAVLFGMLESAVLGSCLFPLHDETMRLGPGVLTDSLGHDRRSRSLRLLLAVQHHRPIPPFAPTGR